MDTDWKVSREVHHLHQCLIPTSIPLRESILRINIARDGSL